MRKILVLLVLVGVPVLSGCLLDKYISSKIAGYRTGIMDYAPLPDPPCPDPLIPCPRPPD